ncbi:hypothetical protein BD311DRAFT_764945 [Dichomitus squalens]|uniref:UBC core domain-containing protein n=1 Tax=Dichomitus squalens TaxID=114155 RepID=A0A4Q9MD62_9APHY|nr:hypothetical protein BD311DRAFT_764945 [Dichomitus squalens]
MVTSTSHPPTRGRKRFQYDLRNATEAIEQGFEVQGLRILSAVPGDEDGSFDCTIAHTNGDLIASLTVLVSDSSEYPSDHTFFCSSQDDLPANVLCITGSVHEDGALTIQDLLMRLLERLAKRTAATHGQGSYRADSEDEHDADEHDDDDDDEDDAADYDLDDDLGLMGAAVGRSKLDQTVLQREFNEIVAYGYHPGFVPFGQDDFALSVSLPAKSLADTIPARALMAWDKQLLSRPQHLTLLISGLRGVYPVVQQDATYTDAAHFLGSVPHFRLGLTPGYKPTPDEAAETLRRYGFKEGYDAHPADPVEEPLYDDYDEEVYDADTDSNENQDDAPEEDEEPLVGFQPFSLSSSLESLLNGHFLRILQLRIRYELGWAGAETLWWEVETSQQAVGDIMRWRGQDIRSADAADELLSESYALPADPLLERNADAPINLPLLAFSYLMRRITLCPRYCLVCHQQLKQDLDALKPYVCSSKLCTYQYYNLNRGPSLEYEIRANPVTVDILVSLAYIAAAEGALDSPLPVGMGLRVKPRAGSSVLTDPDGLCDFDQLQLPEMRSAITYLIDSLPPISDMKKHLEQSRGAGRAKPRLQDFDRAIPDAAWSILRWIVASCTAHLEELTSDEEQVKNIGSEWRQFRFSVGAPDAEAKFRTALQQAQRENANARRYPSLYAFHGSPAKNWHSIIRHGLWFRDIAHGRAYGNGVYFAKDGNVSTGSYSRAASSCWRNSASRIINCVALAEIVNLPTKFVSTQPFFVVAQTEWIICRYLMVKSSGSGSGTPAPTYQSFLGMWPTSGAPQAPEPEQIDESIPYVPLDPAHPLTLGTMTIRIPEPTFALEKVLTTRREEYVSVDYDEDDLKIFEAAPIVPAAPSPVEDDEEAVDDWRHDRAWVEQCIEHLIPPPTESSVQATNTLQRELKGILKEQKAARSLRELGWYFPEDLIGDNLYQWIVELHSFDPTLPVAQDMARCGVNSLVFEIRFPADFPHAPPFFRILKPRFLGFSQGGGGHVTLGGSMCMDLLTADGWLPSYSISAVLLQIKLAISNLDPKAARLAPNWDTPYNIQEALAGYKRAAATHGWKVPRGMDRIAY